MRLLLQTAPTLPHIQFWTHTHTWQKDCWPLGMEGLCECAQDKRAPPHGPATGTCHKSRPCPRISWGIAQGGGDWTD